MSEEHAYLAPGLRVAEVLERADSARLVRAVAADGARAIVLALADVPVAEQRMWAAARRDPDASFQVLAGQRSGELVVVFAETDEDVARDAWSAFADRDHGAAAPAERPDFEPPAGREDPARLVTPAGPAPTSRRRSWLPVYLVLGVIVVVGIAVYTAVQLDPSRAPRFSAAATPTPTPTLRGLVHPLPRPGPRPPDPLLTQVWDPSEPNRIMDLEGFSFAFRAPASWECTRSWAAGVRWECRDESPSTGAAQPPEPASGIVQSDECRAPCRAAGYADVVGRLRALQLPTTGLHRVDDRTQVADTVDPRNANRRLYRMSRTYDSDGDGRLDRHLWVQMTVNPADQLGVRKMFGDLYDATR